jgi:hypothetical protein
MVEHPRPMFPHRHNPDGTIGSICTRCFATIAITTQESELQNPEESHICTRQRASRLRGGQSPRPQRALYAESDPIERHLQMAAI